MGTWPKFNLLTTCSIDSRSSSCSRKVTTISHDSNNVCILCRAWSRVWGSRQSRKGTSRMILTSYWEMVYSWWHSVSPKERRSNRCGGWLLAGRTYTMREMEDADVNSIKILYKALSSNKYLLKTRIGNNHSMHYIQYNHYDYTVTNAKTITNPSRRTASYPDLPMRDQLKWILEHAWNYNSHPHTIWLFIQKSININVMMMSIQIIVPPDWLGCPCLLPPRSLPSASTVQAATS